MHNIDIVVHSIEIRNVQTKHAILCLNPSVWHC